jgi:ribosomal protein S18 acetylase RimI-like enzyme
VTTGLPAGWRRLEPGDAGPWAELLGAIQRADGGWQYTTEHDLLAAFGHPQRDYARGSAGIWDGGTLAGFGLVTLRTSADPVHEVLYAGGVHPGYRGRGLGTRLLDWAQGAAIPLHQERFAERPLALLADCPSDSAAAMALFAARGYEPARRFHGMLRDLRTGLPAGPAPVLPGVAIVPLTRDRIEDARQVRNEAFGDNWGSAETTAGLWARFLDSGAWQPEFSFLASAAGTPADVIVIAESAARSRVIGGRDLHIPVIGTRRASRGRGIASALLARTMGAARAAGCGSASLEVDADSPAGAVAVYQRAGFTVDHTMVFCRKLVLP